MNVLSTTSRAPASWAMSAAAAMSVMASVGLAGVSMKTTRVFGLMAPRSTSRSLVSTMLASTPKREKSRSSTTRDGPYTDALHTTWSPADSRAKNTVDTAAMPDDVASAEVPSSSVATVASSMAMVGLPMRV